MYVKIVQCTYNMHTVQSVYNFLKKLTKLCVSASKKSRIRIDLPEGKSRIPRIRVRPARERRNPA